MSHSSPSGGRASARPSRVTRSLALALALAPALLASPAGAGAPPPNVRLDYEKYTLPNGLEVILHRDNRLPIVAVNLWYHVGPANETAGRTGFAHLFEHMMFQASGHIGEDQWFPILEGAGASFINGTTDFDRTNYLEDVPSNQLELALWMESDRMGFLLDRLDQPMLANQQDVVRNERRQGVENEPYGLVEEEFYHRLFPATHPYYASVIGSHADIQAARLDDVREFFRRYYCTNNASLVIAGDFDVAKTKALVAKYFGTIPRGQPVPKLDVVTPPITQERRAVVTDKVELPRVYMGWITSPFFAPGDADADLAARILGGSKASRLYKTLVYDRKIAQDVSAQQQSLALGSVFQIDATAKPGHTADELERAITEEIARLASEGPTVQELEAAQNATYAGILRGLQQCGGFRGIANRLNQYNQYTHDPGYLGKDLARYGAATPASVKQLVARQLGRDHRVVVFGVPGEKKIPPAPPTPTPPPKSTTHIESKEPWRDARPAAGPRPTTPLPRAKRFTLDNGLTVYLVERHDLPLVAGQLSVRSGGAADPSGMPGLAGFTAAMLDEGTQKRDALAIARDIEALGSTLATGAFQDGSAVTFDALKPNLKPTLEIFSDVALAPAFPEKEVERVRNDRLTSLLEERDSPFRLAIRTFQTALYGPDHPYGHVTLGSEDGIKKITRDDLTRFYRTHFVPGNSALVLAGDLTEAEARALASETFGRWTGTVPAAAPPAEPRPVAARIVIVDKPGAPQTALLFGELGVRRSSPDFEPLNVMNGVLGGLFSSRINMNLREKHGYTYGAFSQVSENRDVGPIWMGAEVRTDVTGASVREVLKESKGMRDSAMTAEELRLSKDSITRSLPSLFETTGSTVGTVGSLDQLGLPPDYYEALPKRVDAMTADEILASTRKYLFPERLLIVAIGDRAKIVPQLTPLKLGAIAVWSPEGKPVRTAKPATKAPRATPGNPAAQAAKKK